jgi:hypothetical protein
MKKYATEIEWAAIMTLFGLAWAFLEKTLGWHGEHIAEYATYSLFGLPFTIALYYFAIRAKREGDLEGKMTWGAGFKSGMMVTLFLVILLPLGQIIIQRLISPDFISNLTDYQVSNGMPRGAAETVYSFWVYVPMAAVGLLFFGAIISAILAAVLKTE